jgi:hypothetical protein
MASTCGLIVVALYSKTAAKLATKGHHYLGTIIWDTDLSAHGQNAKRLRQKCHNVSNKNIATTASHKRRYARESRILVKGSLVGQ